MWIITDLGFFSVVAKPGDASTGVLTVRARARRDLETLRDRHLPSLGEISDGDGTDYRCRVKAPQDTVASAMAAIAKDIDYSNFKSSVAERQGHRRAHVYHNVWSAL